MKSSHVIAAVFIVGLLIYFFSKKTVSGTVTADSKDAVITSSPGTVSYGTELGGS